MKKLLTKVRYNRAFKKLLLKMKLTVAIFLFSLAGVSATTYAQITRLDISSNKNIVDLFREIEEKSEFYFFYQKGDLKELDNVDVNVKNATVMQILDEVLDGTSMDYKVVDRYIIVRKNGDDFGQGIIDAQQNSVSGKVSDSNNQPLPGVSVVIKGTTQGTVTNADGSYTISNIPDNATMEFSFVGMKSQEVVVGTQTTINVVMEEETVGIEEVVAIGYGTQKKVNLTGAVSIADIKEMENRPVANVQQALQGLVPNLQITTSAATGEPGAEMAMNIRGLTSIEGNNSPYVLVDGIPMGINDVDPNDIQSISVLKDAASTSIYGARAAYGVILITTKNGKRSTGDIKVSFSSNYAQGYLLNQPENAGYMDFALTANEGAINAGGAPWYSQDALDRLAKNIANPGSAPEVLPSTDGLSWQIGTDGLGCAATTDWKSLVFENSQRQKYSIGITGGNAKVNFYLSGGIYSEEGVLKQAEDHYSRYNLDAKINAEVTPWMDLSLVTKYRYGEEKYPDGGLGRSFVFMLMTRLKPTKPAFFPGTEVWTGRIGEQSKSTSAVDRQQLILSPRMVLEPVKGWITTVELNYQTNNDNQRYTVLKTPTARPDGKGGSEVIWPSQQGTLYAPTMYSNKYMSPNIYSEYTKSFSNHNLKVLAGYQQETYKYFNIMANAAYLLTDNIPSISTAVGTKTVSDNIGHWATQSLFGRLNYNFAEKYLVEFNYRYDGSSRFEKDERWGVFPSASAGWVISKENFYPLEKIFEFLKIRGSYGSLGNQNVANYLYVPVMPINQTSWLFNDSKLWAARTPNLSSVNLTWEKVNTLDFGIDIQSLNKRLSTTFDWYETRTTDLVGPGEALTAILGTSPPKENSGEIRTRGWELEISWKDKVNDFSYGVRGVLSDYMSTVTKYTNPTNILTTYYSGMKMGEIWGFETEGLFQTISEVDNWHNQQFIYAGRWNPGDVKYRDLNDDKKINIGDNTRDNSGDMKILGNNTPRYQFGFSADASWKGFDLSILFQGIAKKDVDLRAFGTFRGPATAGLHVAVYKEHMDFWRDASSPLGANPDAYFPKPYNDYIGQNGKNYGYATDRYLQDGAYLRLKNLQLGYTIPSSISQKVNISNARIYLSGENLLTFTNLMIFDPEGFKGRYSSIGDQYPLTRIYSIGLNINF